MNTGAADRARKVADIIAGCADITGTPGEIYLRRRGITKTPPASIRFRPRATSKYGALVALNTDSNGEILAVQQIYLTEDGHKAPVKVVKRTNKAVDDWSARGAVRLSGSKPIILCEGVETALSIWQATGRETWACLGVANIGRAPVPDGQPVIIARDGDEPGSSADHQIGKAITKLIERKHEVSVAAPPQGKDFNKILLELGEDHVRSMIDGALPIAPDTPEQTLEIGSDVEIARCVRKDLIKC